MEVLGAGARALMGRPRPHPTATNRPTCCLQYAVQRCAASKALRGPWRPPSHRMVRRIPPWSGVSRDGPCAPWAGRRTRLSLALAAMGQAARAAAAAAGSVEPMPDGWDRSGASARTQRRVGDGGEPSSRARAAALEERRGQGGRKSSCREDASALRMPLRTSLGPPRFLYAPPPPPRAPFRVRSPLLLPARTRYRARANVMTEPP